MRASFKDAAKLLVNTKVLKSDEEIPNHGGIQVLPILWRQKVKMDLKHPQDKKGVNPLCLEDITLGGVPSIRMLVSDVILDVLLYMTPKYRQEMLQHITSELNRIYALYKERNPKFNGKVSIYGHSLGSVLAYDILTLQKTQEQPLTKTMKTSKTEVDLSELLSKYEALEPISLDGLMMQSNIKLEALQFQPHAFFAVGSPVGLFLLLKGNRLSLSDVTDPESNAERLCVDKIYNIFHPNDPVAYRIEPLVDYRYKSLKPAPIAYTKGGLRSTLTGISDISNDLVGYMAGFVNSTAGLVTRAWFTPKSDDTQMSGKEDITAKDSDTSKQDVSSKGSEKTKPATESLFTPPTRLDFALQEGIMENAYISALGVHMNYWTDQDHAAFIVRQIYDK
jgi:hypothetical protein